MKRFILTGTPGCGKTALIRALDIQGYEVVEEAATDSIAYKQALGVSKPWEEPNFIEDILKLQQQRHSKAAALKTEYCFFDRSAFCTYALAVYLKIPVPFVLEQELEQLLNNNYYNKTILFVENLGFCKITEARTLSFEEALSFEKIHKNVYTQFGFKFFNIPAAPLEDRLKSLIHEIVLL